MNDFKSCLTILSSLIELSAKDKKWDEYKALIHEKDIVDSEHLVNLKNEQFKIKKLNLLLPI